MSLAEDFVVDKEQRIATTNKHRAAAVFKRSRRIMRDVGGELPGSRLHT